MKHSNVKSRREKKELPSCTNTLWSNVQIVTRNNFSDVVVLPEDDGFDKTRAWYDKNIDISNIPKGEYVIYITTTSNVTDISEFTEKLNRNLNSVKKDIQGKHYQFTINMNKGNRIELIVT